MPAGFVLVIIIGLFLLDQYPHIFAVLCVAIVWFIIYIMRQSGGSYSYDSSPTEETVTEDDLKSEAVVSSKCPDCNGTKDIFGLIGDGVCSGCQGDRETALSGLNKATFNTPLYCNRCGGSGRCTTCHGTGKVND